MFKATKKFIYLSLGIFFVLLGIIGAFLPLLPTTPFLLLSTFLFSKSSERFYQWVINHRRFGPSVHDWHEHRVIRPRAKIFATVLILLSFSYPIIFVSMAPLIKIVLAIVAGAILSFILTRKSHPTKELH